MEYLVDRLLHHSRNTGLHTFCSVWTLTFSRSLRSIYAARLGTKRSRYKRSFNIKSNNGFGSNMFPLNGGYRKACKRT